MQMKGLARRFGRDFRCHKTLLQARVTQQECLPQVLNRLPKDEKSAVFQWITRTGPFWDEPHHDAGDYFECADEIVTDSAIGEVAFRKDKGEDARLVSMRPSDWNYLPITVTWHIDDQDQRNFQIDNYWEAGDLEAALARSPLPITSWHDLQTVAHDQFGRLDFTEDWMEPLTGHPFSRSAATRILSLLNVLHRLILNADDPKQREEEKKILTQYFQGERAWFSDSSTTEKNDFRNEMTFEHPRHKGKYLFCPQHGKISRGVLRLHFSWPIRQGEPCYVVYVGPKMTKR